MRRYSPGYVSYGGSDYTDDADDCNGHGTHCAGTAMGTSAGVAKAATVVPVQVLGCSGSGYTSDIIDGMEWAMEGARHGFIPELPLSARRPACLSASHHHNPPPTYVLLADSAAQGTRGVISMSIGGGGPDSLWDAACEAAHDDGMVRHTPCRHVGGSMPRPDRIR